MRVIQVRQHPTPSPKIGSLDPSIFCTGYLRDNPPKPWKFCENLTTSFWEIFWNQNYSFLGPPLQGVRMLRFYFWVLEGPQLHKKFRDPWTSRFGDMGGQSFNFATLSPKIGSSDPLHILHRDDLQKPWKFCESLANSFRDIWLFTVRAYRRDTIVSSTLKVESLYSDKYSFTTTTTAGAHVTVWLWLTDGLARCEHWNDVKSQWLT